MGLVWNRYGEVIGTTSGKSYTDNSQTATNTPTAAGRKQASRGRVAAAQPPQHQPRQLQPPRLQHQSLPQLLQLHQLPRQLLQQAAGAAIPLRHGSSSLKDTKPTTPLV